MGRGRGGEGRTGDEVGSEKRNVDVREDLKLREIPKNPISLSRSLSLALLQKPKKRNVPPS